VPKLYYSRYFPLIINLSSMLDTLIFHLFYSTQQFVYGTCLNKFEHTLWKPHQGCKMFHLYTQTATTCPHCKMLKNFVPGIFVYQYLIKQAPPVLLCLFHIPDKICNQIAFPVNKCLKLLDFSSFKTNKLHTEILFCTLNFLYLLMLPCCKNKLGTSCALKAANNL
jgi:hypothetical protein